MQLVLFNPWALPFRARVDLGEIAIKGCSAFPKAKYIHWVGSYPSAEKQLVYFTAPADWARCDQREKKLEEIAYVTRSI